MIFLEDNGPHNTAQGHLAFAGSHHKWLAHFKPSTETSKSFFFSVSLFTHFPDTIVVQQVMCPKYCHSGVKGLTESVREVLVPLQKRDTYT